MPSGPRQRFVGFPFRQSTRPRVLRSRSRREYHIVVLGAGGVGKSCLTAQFVHNEWIESYDPTIEDTYRKQINVDGRQCILEILDTAGTEQFTAMRDLYMKSGQGFLLVFSITSLSSLRELSALREDILRIKDSTSVPLVLVGNKSDLEEDRTVSRQRAFSLFQNWGAIPYYETSARRRANVDEVFVDLCRQIIRREAEQKQLEKERRRQQRISPANSFDDGDEEEDEEDMIEGKRRSGRGLSLGGGRSERRRRKRRGSRARERMSCVIL